MAIYLIDFENVHSDGLKGIEQLSENDVCYVFYSEHAGVLTFNIHKKIIESRAKIYYVEAQVGMKNALDFQLVSYLGYMIREDQEAYYCVISNDRAFALVADFWKKKGVEVSCAVSLAAAVRLKENEKIASRLASLLSDKKEREFVAKCIEELSTKQGINNRIAKKYGTTRAGEIYKLIKPVIADKKGGTEKDA